MRAGRETSDCAGVLGERLGEIKEAVERWDRDGVRGCGVERDGVQKSDHGLNRSSPTPSTVEAERCSRVLSPIR